MKNLIILAAACCSVAISSGASAQTTYTDPTAFKAAAGLTQTETFSKATPGDFASVGGVYTATFDGFSVTGQNNGNYVGIANNAVSDSGPNYDIPSNFTNQNYLTWADATGGTISLTINFAAATTAFGFDWFNTDYSDQYQISLPGGTQFSGPPFTEADNGVATSGFFGLVSATPFTSILITDRNFGGYISDEGIDNLVTNGAGSVVLAAAAPEPGTWLMMIVGFGLAGFALRSAKKRSEQKFTARINGISSGAIA